MPPPASPAATWSRLHHGLEPDRLPFVRGWLRLMWWTARPLVALRVPPLAVTAAGVACALAAAWVARDAPGPALVLVLLAVLSDGLDGAVAVLADRASALGARADKVADRVADCAFAAVLWRCGAPWWLAVAAGGISLAHEGFRELAGGVRRTRITVAERPTRAVCAVLACASSGVSAAAWPPTVCGAVWVGLAVVGLAQLSR